MLLALVATVLSLVRLLHRATRLLQIPIPTLIQLLGIDIPSPPHVCLDSVTADAVTLHWSLPDRATSVARHVIQMNGQNVGESEKRETTVTITGLNPDQVYGVRVLAVNSNNYSSAGPLIRLRTRRKSENLVLTNIQPISDNSHDKSLLPDTSPSRKHDSLVHTQFKRGNRDQLSSSSRRDRNDTSSSFVAATQPYTIESLSAELEQIRSEISDTIQQHGHAEEEYTSAEAALQTELQSLREKRKEEDVGRSQLRGESKSLEESKRTLEAQKSKVDKAVKHKIEIIDKIKADFTRWEQEADTAKKRMKEIDRLKAKRNKDIKVREVESRRILHQGHKEIAELEDEIRGLIAKIKKAEMEKDPKLGNASENAFTKLLHAEDVEDKQLERSWQEVQKSLELRYVDVFEQFRDAKEKFGKAQETYASMSMQGSISPVEATKSAKRRNRARNKTRQNVSSPINSYPLHDSRFPDASTFNNLQFPSLHSTFAQFDGSLNNSSSSSLPLNPFSSTNTPSLVDLFPQPLDNASVDDLLSNGGPISPSVNMLLPSNLFVTDDLPQNLSDAELDDTARTRSKTQQSELSMDSSSLFLPSLSGQPLTPGQSLLLSSSGPPSPQSFSHQPISRPYSPLAALSTTSTPQSSFTNGSMPAYFAVGSGLKLNNMSSSGSISDSPLMDKPLTPLNLVMSAASESDDEIRRNSTTSSTSSGFSLMKRSPSRRLLFSGVSGLSSIGNIGRKKESFENSDTSSALASDADEFLNPDEPRTPGRRFANLFSFSTKRNSTSRPGPGPTVSLRETVQAPIGTRRSSFSGSFDSPVVTSPESPTRVSVSTPPSTSTTTTTTTTNSFSTGMGNLFGSPVFGRRNSRFPWDLKNESNGSSGGNGQGARNGNGNGTGTW
ncbi:hypothetical protein V1512DRAFT_226172 [Lipomyces arxii]|uniref:uncharacterized protein n=1 Tax=Lipomyces arxii TaxID=56418 RepID=UPI0034CE4BB9